MRFPLECFPRGHLPRFQCVDQTAQAAVHRRDGHIVVLGHHLQDLLADGQLAFGLAGNEHRLGEVITVAVRLDDAPLLIHPAKALLQGSRLLPGRRQQTCQQLFQAALADEVAGAVRREAGHSGSFPPGIVLQQKQRLLRQAAHPLQKFPAVHIFQRATQHHDLRVPALFQALQQFFAAAVLAAQDLRTLLRDILVPHPQLMYIIAGQCNAQPGVLPLTAHPPRLPPAAKNTAFPLFLSISYSIPPCLRFASKCVSTFYNSIKQGEKIQSQKSVKKCRNSAFVDAYRRFVNRNNAVWGVSGVFRQRV